MQCIEMAVILDFLDNTFKHLYQQLAKKHPFQKYSYKIALQRVQRNATIVSMSLILETLESTGIAPRSSMLEESYDVLYKETSMIPVPLPSTPTSCARIVLV